MVNKYNGVFFLFYSYNNYRHNNTDYATTNDNTNNKENDDDGGYHNDDDGGEDGRLLIWVLRTCSEKKIIGKTLSMKITAPSSSKSGAQVPLVPPQITTVYEQTSQISLRRTRLNGMHLMTSLQQRTITATN